MSCGHTSWSQIPLNMNGQVRIQIFMYKDVQQTITSNNGNWKQSKYWTIRGVLSAQLKKMEKRKQNTEKKMKSLIIPILWNNQEEIAELVFPAFFYILFLIQNWDHTGYTALWFDFSMQIVLQILFKPLVILLPLILMASRCSFICTYHDLFKCFIVGSVLF